MEQNLSTTEQQATEIANLKLEVKQLKDTAEALEKQRAKQTKREQAWVLGELAVRTILFVLAIVFYNELPGGSAIAIILFSFGIPVISVIWLFLHRKLERTAYTAVFWGISIGCAVLFSLLLLLALYGTSHSARVEKVCQSKGAFDVEYLGCLTATQLFYPAIPATVQLIFVMLANNPN